ncbi:hypothetical protein [Leifsonia sp. Leaf264]|uniref:hypothetical protein n=1 Tax=Leifsonia sp. Leaf264 TaxID=1736314 RepID=UPI0006F6ADF0|nr:hypothetical protein [Leifsonia sp. Leaf264]KQO98832.1 hypothetical protein ASF30_12275 [Leifsonia sp. Leaf264]
MGNQKTFTGPATVDRNGAGHAAANSTAKPGTFVSHVLSDADFGELTSTAAGGYDTVEVNEHGTTQYFKTSADGSRALHREDGHAVVYRDGGGYYMLDGNYLFEPFSDDVKLELRYTHTDADGIRTQYWAYDEDGHSWEAHIEEGGVHRYFHDGQPHRLGDPAVVHPDGSEEWWRDGVKYDIFAEGDEYLGDAWNGQFRGAKYDGTYPDVAKVAASVRQDFKYAQKAGLIPDHATWTVNTDKYAGGQSIHVVINGLTDAETRDPKEYAPYALNDRTARMEKRLEAIIEQYGRHTIDRGGDYTRASGSFIPFVRTATDRDQEYAAAEKAKASAKRAAAKKAKAEVAAMSTDEIAKALGLR